MAQSSADSRLPLGEVNLNGTISGNRFSGGATYASKPRTGTTPVAPNAMNGNFAGGFFGPNAAEIAGSANLNGGGQQMSFGFGGYKR